MAERRDEAVLSGDPPPAARGPGPPLLMRTSEPSRQHISSEGNNRPPQGLSGDLGREDITGSMAVAQARRRRTPCPFSLASTRLVLPTHPPPTPPCAGPWGQRNKNSCTPAGGQTASQGHCTQLRALGSWTSCISGERSPGGCPPGVTPGLGTSTPPQTQPQRRGKATAMLQEITKKKGQRGGLHVYTHAHACTRVSVHQRTPTPQPTLLASLAAEAPRSSWPPVAPSHPRAEEATLCLALRALPVGWALCPQNQATHGLSFSPCSSDHLPCPAQEADQMRPQQ